ncbi:hypothetical protein QUB63_29565 [Microcoleus sp. ARI1-B5]
MGDRSTGEQQAVAPQQSIDGRAAQQVIFDANRVGIADSRDRAAKAKNE